MFIDLPKEVILELFEYLSCNDKKALSFVTKRTHAIALEKVTCLKISCDKEKICSRLYPIYTKKQDLIKRVIYRYPNLKKIIFGDWRRSRLQRYVRDFFISLQRVDEQIFPDTVKKIQFKKLTNLKLTKLILETLSYQITLESLELSFSKECYELSSKIQPIITNILNLKSLYLGLKSYGWSQDFCFEKNTQLKKLILSNWLGGFLTIESLENCKNLQLLNIDLKNKEPQETIKKILAKQSWDLKDFKTSIPFESDAEFHAISKNFPNLEHLTIGLGENISNTALSSFGNNYINLKSLILNAPYLTDLGLAKLSSNLSQLELLEISNANEITDIGIAAALKNCTNLKAITIIGQLSWIDKASLQKKYVGIKFNIK